MQAIKRRNPLTESFLVQLDVDLEGAGIEDTNALRVQLANKSPTEASRSEGCPMQQLHLDHAPVYGDNGIAAYNEPSGNPNLSSTVQQQQQPAFNFTETTEMTDESIAFMSMGGNTFDLPNRPAGQTPGSNPSSGMHQSPQSFNNPEMEITPDTSAGERLTPGSQYNSSGHASNKSYSPSNLWQSDNGSTNNNNNNINSTTNAFADFDMHNYQPSNDNQGFVLPSGWGSSGTGMTPGGGTGMTPSGGTGFTPGPTGYTPNVSGMGDMLNMSDAEWNQMMDNMQYNDWQTGLDHSEVLTINGRKIG